MKYDHPLWDTMIHLMDFAKEQIIKSNHTMYYEVNKIYESAINTFTLHRTQAMWLFHYMASEDAILTDRVDNLNEVEVEATRGSIKATSTKEAQRAIAEAKKRIAYNEKMRPVIEAEEKAQQAKAKREEKERLAKEDKENKERPKRELEEAKRAEKEAEAELEKAKKRI